jgi:hypothetical protein
VANVQLPMALFPVAASLPKVCLLLRSAVVASARFTHGKGKMTPSQTGACALPAFEWQTPLPCFRSGREVVRVVEVPEDQHPGRFEGLMVVAAEPPSGRRRRATLSALRIATKEDTAERPAIVQASPSLSL